jgi:hypothetical protein
MSGKTASKFGVYLALLLASPAFASDWRVDDTISALDGSRTYAAAIQSSNTIRIAAGDDERATLVVRCVANQLDAYIAWPQQIGKDALDMRWRADGGASMAEVWSVSHDGSATFSENARRFLVNLKTAHHATFQLVLANFDTLEATFDVTGADTIANTALSACPGSH